MTVDNNIDNSVASLMDDLKKEDSNYASMCKRLQYVYWVLIPLYILMGAIHVFDSGVWSDGIGSFCFAIAMFLFAFVFRKYSKEYKYVDYSMPTAQMLRVAAYRYSIFRKELIWLLAALIFLDAGLVMNSSMNASFFQIQIIFVPLMLISILIGVIVWFYKYKHLRDRARAFLAEIEE